MRAALRALWSRWARRADDPGGPDPIAAALARARAKLGALGEASARRALDGAERAALASAFDRDLPRFGHRAITATVTDVGAPFFERVRVLRLDSPAPFPPEAAHAALAPRSGARVLSGHPAALAALCAEERPRHAEDPDLALVLAGLAGAWTGASLLSELRVSSVDEIPFRRAGDYDRAREAAVRRAHGREIAPPRIERVGAGVRVTSWLVSESRLRRRCVHVGDGMITATEEIVAEVPVHPGRVWGEVGGRLVPVG